MGSVQNSWDMEPPGLSNQGLAKHLRNILRFELSATIPTEPAGTMKMRKFVPVLGTITGERQMLDANHFKKGQDMKDVVMKLAR